MKGWFLVTSAMNMPLVLPHTFASRAWRLRPYPVDYRTGCWRKRVVRRQNTRLSPPPAANLFGWL